MWKPIAAAAITTVALSTPALADTHVTYVDDGGHPSTQLYVKDGKVRMENGGNGMIFDAAAGSITVIDAGDESYMVLDPAAMEKMAAQVQQQVGPRMGEMQARMQMEMAHMSPEQRAGMEQMMAGLAAQGGGPAAAQAPEVEIRDLGSARKIAGYGCKDIRLMVQGKGVARMCVADPGTLDIPEDDRATLEAMHEGLRKMAAMGPGAPPVPDIMPRGLALSYAPEGVMAREGGGPETLKDISTRTLEADLFAPPAGYSRRAMPGGPE